MLLLKGTTLSPRLFDVHVPKALSNPPDIALLKRGSGEQEVLGERFLSLLPRQRGTDAIDSRAHNPRAKEIRQDECIELRLYCPV